MIDKTYRVGFISGAEFSSETLNPRHTMTSVEMSQAVVLNVAICER